MLGTVGLPRPDQVPPVNRRLSDLVIQTGMALHLPIVEAFLGRADSSVQVASALGDCLLERDFLLGPVSALQRDQGRCTDILLHSPRTHLDSLEIVAGGEGFFPEPSRIADCGSELALSVEIGRCACAGTCSGVAGTGCDRRYSMFACGGFVSREEAHRVVKICQVGLERTSKVLLAVVVG